MTVNKILKPQVVKHPSSTAKLTTGQVAFYGVGH